MSVFGRLLPPTAPEIAIEQLLRKWVDYYLKEIERQWEVGYTIEPPRSWVRRNVIEALPGEEDSPAVYIVSRGWNARDRRGGKGQVTAPFGAGIAVIAGGQDANNARDLMGYITIALAGIMMHRRNLDGLLPGARVQSWDDLRLDDLGVEAQRSHAMARMEFTVTVDDILTTGAGPRLDEPPADPDLPPDEWPTVQTVHNEVIPKED